MGSAAHLQGLASPQEGTKPLRWDKAAKSHGAAV